MPLHNLGHWNELTSRHLIPGMDKSPALPLLEVAWFRSFKMIQGPLRMKQWEAEADKDKKKRLL